MSIQLDGFWEANNMVGQTLLRTMHIKRLYDKFFEDCLEELGLTMIESTIILFLKNHKAYNTARDFCNMRMIPKSNASNGIRLLERKGMIRIEYDKEDKKLHRLYLTEKADAAAEELLKVQKEFITQLFGILSVEEINQFDNLFGKLDERATVLLQEKGLE